MKNLKFFISLVVLQFVFSTSIVGQTVLKDTIKKVATLTESFDVGANSELHIAQLPINTSFEVKLTDDNGWVILEDTKPSTIIREASRLSFIKVDDGSGGFVSITNSNARVTNYLQGCVIMPHNSSFKPLKAFPDPNFQGTVIELEKEKYYRDEASSGNSTPNNITINANIANISSFKLKKGYMATMAQNKNGTGFSRVFIADKQDIEINQLQKELDEQISFIRVFPWRYTAKKGYGATEDFIPRLDPALEVKASWYYRWTNLPLTNIDTSADDLNSELIADIEFVPLKFNDSENNDEANIWKQINDLQDVNHVLGFNEPDAGGGQSDMSMDRMIEAWPKMLESGLRVGSPAPARLGDDTFIYEFIDRCDAANLRVDFIAIHDYRHTNAHDFYLKCKEVHEKTGRPIWVTEFHYGASWNVNPSFSPDYETAAERIKEIIERYDKEGIIERFSIFNFEQKQLTVNGTTFDFNKAVFNQSVTNPTDFTESSITATGEVYRDFTASMAFNSKRRMVSVEKNIALFKPITATSGKSILPPENAVDGNKDVAWTTNITTNNSPSTTASKLVVDLEDTYRINSIYIDQDNINGNGATNIQIQAIISGEWSVMSNIDDENLNAWRNYNKIFANPFETNKVKVTFRKKNGNTLYTVNELKIFGVRVAKEAGRPSIAEGKTTSSTNEPLSTNTPTSDAVDGVFGRFNKWAATLNSGDVKAQLAVDLRENPSQTFLVDSYSFREESAHSIDFELQYKNPDMQNWEKAHKVVGHSSIDFYSNDFVPFVASEVRLLVTNHSSTENIIRMQEFQVFGELIATTVNKPPTEKNVAKNKTATASNTVGSFVPTRANDGSFVTASRWVADLSNPFVTNPPNNFLFTDEDNYEFVFINPSQAWLEIDLGSEHLIDSFYFKEDVDNGHIKNFQLLYQDANGEWQIVKKVSDHIPVGSGEFISEKLKPFKASKVRLEIISHTTSRIRLFELELYGEALTSSKSNSKTKTAIEDVAEEKDVTSANLYPNPFKNEIRVELANTYSNAQVTLINLLGKTVLTKSFSNNQSIYLNTSNLKTGYYFARVSIDGVTTFKKLIKN